VNGLVGQVQAAAQSGGDYVWALALGVAIALVAVLGSLLLLVARRVQRLSDEWRVKIEKRLGDGSQEISRGREDRDLLARDVRANLHQLHALIGSVIGTTVTRREFERLDSELDDWKEWVEGEVRAIRGIKEQVLRLTNGTTKTVAEKKP
jgi:hypothetical protein